MITVSQWGPDHSKPQPHVPPGIPAQDPILVRAAWKINPLGPKVVRVRILCKKCGSFVGIVWEYTRVLHGECDCRPDDLSWQIMVTPTGSDRQLPLGAILFTATYQKDRGEDALVERSPEGRLLCQYIALLDPPAAVSLPEQLPARCHKCRAAHLIDRRDLTSALAAARAQNTTQTLRVPRLQS